MAPVTIDVTTSPELAWILKDVLPHLVSDCRAAEVQHAELSEQINRMSEVKVKIGEHLEALGGSVVGLAQLARLRGATEQQLADVIGEHLAHQVFVEVEF